MPLRERNTAWKKVLEKESLATEENLSTILNHQQSSVVQDCITLLGGKSALKKDNLDLILKCKDLENIPAALDTLARAGIAGKQEVGIILARPPKSREVAAYALSRLKEVNLLTDEFREEVNEDRWDGGDTIAAINTLVSSDILRNLLTEDNLRQVLEHAAPASVATIIVDCCKVTGTAFINMYAPSILQLDRIATENLDAIVDCLQENAVLTAETIKSIFECRIGAKEANAANAVLKSNEVFVPGLLYDCCCVIYRHGFNF